jgi:signal transduction histidine kinase
MAGRIPKWDVVYRRTAGRGWLGDALAAALYTVACFAEIADPGHGSGRPQRALDVVGVLLVLAGAAALAAQRRLPATAVLVTGAVSATLSTVGYVVQDPVGFLGASAPTGGVFIALYALSLRQGRPRSVLALAAAVIAGFAVVLAFAHQPRPGDLAGVVTIFPLAWVLGDAQRVRRAHAASVRQRAEDLERERHALAEVAVVQERARIARELHDVVAHHVSLMIVNAAAADRQLVRDLEAASRLLHELVTTGQAAVTEMRRMLTVLRNEDTDDEPCADRHPQPTLDGLDELAETFRTAGLRVVLAVRGSPRPLPAGIDLTAYRILQESLTNALRHAGVGTRASVTVDFHADALLLDVTDDGAGSGPTNPMRTPGHGLIGMRERVHSVDGLLRAEYRPEGGFTVRAVLPLPSAESGPPVELPA